MINGKANAKRTVEWCTGWHPAISKSKGIPKGGLVQRETMLLNS